MPLGRCSRCAYAGALGRRVPALRRRAMPIPASTKPRLHLRRLGVAGALAAACALSACTSPANVARKPAPAYVVVADHLANPRGLFIAKGSADLYFTEAGLGGGTAKTGVLLGAGHSGRVSIVRGADAAHPKVHRLAADLWSSAEVEDRLHTLGPAGLTTSNGSLYLVVSEEFGDHVGAQPQEGRLLKVTDSGVAAV